MKRMTSIGIISQAEIRAEIRDQIILAAEAGEIIPGLITGAFRDKGSLLVATTENGIPILILFKRLLGKSLIRKIKKKRASSKFMKKRKNKSPWAQIRPRGVRANKPKKCLGKTAGEFRKKTLKFSLLTIILDPRPNTKRRKRQSKPF